MAWSYSQATGERYLTAGTYWARWWNAWSITELAPVDPDHIKLRVSLSSSGFYQEDSYTWYCTDTLSCNGQTVTVRSGYTISGSAGYTQDVTVPASWNGQRVSMNIGKVSTSAVLTATLAVPSTVSADNGYFGSVIPVTIVPALSGVRHVVTVSCAGRTETLLTVDDAALTVNWTPAIATYAPLITSSESASATITCETFYNGTSMGSTTATITVSFAAGSLPPALSTGWAAAAPYNSGDAAGLSVYVQGYSRAALTFDSSKIVCQHGASVAGYAISCDGVTVSASPFRTGILTGTSASIVCTVTDSRGQTASETLTVAVQPYSAPVITAADIFRCDAQGGADDDGSYLSVTASASISSLNGENSAALTVATRVLSGSFGTETTLTTGQATVLGGFSPDTSYQTRITLADALNAVTLLRTLPTRKWAMKFKSDGNGVAFGKAFEYTGGPAMELSNGWALVLHGPEGQAISLDYARALKYGGYGYCTTGATTLAKTVSIPGITELIEGMRILVKFQNQHNKTGAATLNVNELGAINIKRIGTTDAARYEWQAGELIEFVYDGTYWLMLDGGLATTTYYGVTKLATSATSTSTSLALTPASLNSFWKNAVSDIATYSTSAAYAVGDYCRYSYNIWRCNTAIPAAGEAWTEAHWTKVDPLFEMIPVSATKSGSVLSFKNRSGAVLFTVTL